MASLELSRSYRWEPQSAQSLLVALERLAREIADAEASFSGWCEDQRAAGETVRFESPGEFLPFAMAAGSFGLDFRSFAREAGSVTYGRYGTETPADLRTITPLDRKEQILTAIAAFERATGLVPLTDPTAESSSTKPKSVSLHRRYRLKRPNATALLDQFIEHIAPLGDSSTPRVWGSLDVGPPAQAEFQVSTLEELRTLIDKPFRRLEVTLSHPNTQFSLSLDMSPKAGLSLRASVPVTRQEAALEAIAGFERAASVALQLGNDQDEGKRGLKVSCFARASLRADWLDTLMATLARQSFEPRHGNVRLEIRGDTTEHSFGHLQSAVVEAKARWSDLLVMRADLWGDPCDVFIVIEPRLDLVTLEVHASGEHEVREIIGRFEQALDLEERSDIDYDNAKTSRRYRFRTFDRTKVADAVRLVIHDFVSPDPVIRKDSSVAEADTDGNWIYRNFDRLDPFLERLASPKAFAEARVIALGPRNRVVSVLISDNRSRLEVRSSFDAARFQDMADVLQKCLSLTEDASEPEGAAAKSAWQQIMALEGLYGKAVVAAAVVVSSVITFLVQATIRRDTVVLVTPASVESGPRRVAAGCIALEWEVRDRALFDEGRTLLRELGTLQVDAGDGRRVTTLANFRSGDELFFPEGAWIIYVYDPVRKRRSPSVQLQATSTMSTRDSGGSSNPTPRRCLGSRPAPQ